MNPLSFISPGLQIYVRIAVIALLAALCFGGGWEVNGWRLGTELASVKAEHAQTVADAYKASLAAQKKADADHQALAADLAAMSATAHENLTRSEHAIDLLRPAVAAGTRVVRVAGTCPAGPGGVSEAAPSGRVDPGAGAVLAPEVGQRVLDLRAGASRFDAKLAACQEAVSRLTGQPRPSSTTTP